MSLRRILILSGALLVMLMAGISAAGQEPTTGASGDTARVTESNIAKPGKGSIRGRVLSPGGNSVSQNLKISLLTVMGLQAVVYTDTQGWFEFPDLNPGKYEVQAETTGTDYQVVNQNVQ